MIDRIRHARTTSVWFSMAWFFFSLCSTSPADAVHPSEGVKGDFELRGFLRFTGIANRTPGTPELYSDQTDGTFGSIGRLLVSAGAGDRFRFDINAFQSFLATTGDGLTRLGASLRSPERSAALIWAQQEEPDRVVRLGLDWLNAQLSFDRLDITLGRQPVNLATVFYFTPNDFFAPFNPETFFRAYKPGVDSARVEVQLEALSQLSLLGVLGYDEDPSEDNGWSRTPSLGRASGLARVATARFGFEWALLGGTVHEDTIAGGSFQGELFEWLGIRAEGHYASPRTGGRDPFGKVAVDLEHHFENSLHIRLEQFYNGGGYNSIDDFNKMISLGESSSLFMSRHYSALDFTYEVSPLLTADWLTIINWIDESVLITVYSVYSLANEMELSPAFSIPLGKEPESEKVKSEFGRLPYSVSVEFRWYF